ncbi:hypothetical protein SAMN03159496_05570 [Rhizobium sp. NFR07]|nr:hypothetical protein SAMN03159496_05570 [Rhizobium sp. NFR07]
MQFRGGEFDVQEVGAFTYMGGRDSNLRHVRRIGRFCSIGPALIAGSAEHDLSQISTHSLLQGHWSRAWPELLTDFHLRQDQIDHSRKAYLANTIHRSRPIEIGSDVWIGDGVFIARGVTIGDGAAVAARSVVVKDVPPYAVVGGAPAREIRLRFEEEAVEKLLSLRWWDYGPEILADCDWTNVSRCIASLEARISSGAPKYIPKKIRIAPDNSITEYDPLLADF